MDKNTVNQAMRPVYKWGIQKQIANDTGIAASTVSRILNPGKYGEFYNKKNRDLVLKLLSILNCEEV